MGVFNCSLSARECYQGPSEQVMRPRRRLKRSPARMTPKAIACALGEVSDAAGGRFSPVPKGCGPFCLPRRSGPRLRRPCYDLRTAPSGRQNGSQRGSQNLFRGSLGYTSTAGTSLFGRYGGQGRNRTGVRGFAGRCMTTLPPGQTFGELQPLKTTKPRWTEVLP